MLNLVSKKTFKSALLAGTAAAAALAVTAVPAIAQDSGSVEKVTVTGTRIQKKDFTAISPVTTVTSQDLQITNTTNVERLLNDLPSIVPGNTIVSNNQGGENFATVDLRGLGAGRTLVLVNGQRVPGGSTSGTVDLNTLPAGLIERIEVVTGGASAVYGSDAMSGVVNFILKDNYEGFEVNVQAGQAERGLAEERGIDALMGFSTPDGKGNVTMYASWATREGVLQSEFDYARNSAGLQGVYNTITGEYMDVRIADHASEWLTNAQLAAIYGPGAAGYVFSSGGSATPPWGIFSSPGNNFGTATPLSTLLPATFAGANTDCDTATAGVNVGAASTVTFNDAGALSPTNQSSSAGFLNGNRCRVPDRAAGSQRYNFAPDNFIILPSERFTLSAFGNYEIDKSTKLKVGATYADSNTQVQLAPTPATSPVPVSIRVVLTPTMSNYIQTNHADFWAAIQSRPNPAGDITVNNWRSSDLGPRVGDFTNNSLNFFAELSGDFEGTSWEWNVSAAYGRNRFTEVLQHNLGSTQLIQGLRGCDNGFGAPMPGMLPGCVTVDIFGQGNLTQDMIDFLDVTTKTVTTVEQSRVTGYATGDLWDLFGAGPAVAVVGAEYRLDQAEKIVDDALKTGDIYGFNAEQNQVGNVDVYEVFTEVSIPIVADQPFMKYLGVEAGYRRSDYNIAGVTSAYKYGAEYAPFEWLRFRGIYNTATRAPNIGELFQNGDQGFVTVTDPCNDIGANPATEAFCATNGNIGAGFVPGALYPGFAQQNQQLQGLFFGNQSLSPETAETTTLGFVLNTGSDWFGIGRLRASVDHYDINIEDFIGVRGVGTVLNSCYGNLGVGAQAAIDCSNIFRDPATGQIAFVQAGLQNNTYLQTTGWDIQVDFAMEMSELFGDAIPGRLSVRELYSIVDSFDVAGTELSGTTEAGVGGAIFDWKSSLTMAYSLDNLTVSTRWTYVPGLKQDYVGGTFQGSGAPMTPAASYWGTSLQYQVFESMMLTLAVDNVFDERPPQTVTGALDQANIDAQTYDPLGRQYSLSVRTKF